MEVFHNLASILSKKPHAVARLFGSEEYMKIRGEVYFYSTKQGVIVACAVKGLPEQEQVCKTDIFAFHIHDGEFCIGNKEDPFARALSHYNPQNCQHPYHAGDMPPLFSAAGIALSVFLTDRFSIKEIYGKTVIIHSMPDDFHTQPGGNSGKKIACGEIVKMV